ncbi:HEPN domain-containing protein [Bdellovibrio sp. HCB2-146]|uniref:HEPN domain-containing protein n=1 Tax=Bdellovibrio sp. HCB2-146 TaxID=3394362 RepID=UPI0039BD4205
MNPAVKSLIIKAQDNIDTAKKLLSDDKQHDIVGYNLAQAGELLLKALCEMRQVEYSHEDEGHDLDLLMETLEESGFGAVSSYADVVELTMYNATNASVRKDDRLDLTEYLGHVEDLKKFVGEQYKLH